MIDPLSPDYAYTPVAAQRPPYFYAPQDTAATAIVSILTPFYNTSPVFHETARSVLQQSLQQWEWLIVNDGSTDPASLEILKEYRRMDPRIRVVDHDANKGPSAARNTGFRLSACPYVLLLDSDDLLEPTAAEKWLWCLESFPEYAFVKGYSVSFEGQRYLWKKGFHHGTAFLESNLVGDTSLIRKSVHLAVGGFDEDRRTGFEDWEFWLRCAAHGHWGHTFPEYLDWYRRRADHGDRWADWTPEGHKAYSTQLRGRYPKLWDGGFPQIKLRWQMPFDDVPDVLPVENRLKKNKPRLVMILPWLTTGGADKFNLDLVQQLIQRGWEITIVTTLKGDNPWMPQFTRWTPDVFILRNFLRPVDHPRFLRYLIQSRQADAVLMSNSEFGYHVLPYLRSHFPHVAFTDYCHMEEENWKNGGYPRSAQLHQEQLDLNIVSSHHLKQWMVRRQADPHRIEVCYTNADTVECSPHAPTRQKVRAELEISDHLPVILYAGRLVKQKQPKVFAQVMDALHQRGVRFLALVAGDGPDRGWLETYIRTHKLRDCVRLLGNIPNRRVRELLQASDLFFLPSEWEGISLAIYEAMACGIPVVGADVGGQRELVINGCGRLLPKADEATEIRQYTETLAKLMTDVEARRAMGQQARARICQHFPLNQMGERMVALLRRAVELHATSPRPIVPLALGRACAVQAVEYARLWEVSEKLWAEREQSRGTASNPGTGVAPLRKTDLKTVILRGLRKAFRFRNGHA